MTEATAPQSGGYTGIVEKKSFELASLTTVGGRTIAPVRIGYETIGTLNAAGDNAILIPHYFSGTSHFAGRYRADDALPGYWDAIVGPGKPLDTDKYFLIGVDSLCNLNVNDGVTVSTGPASIDPATGKPYGLGFPQVQIRDFVTVQRALVAALGVRKLHAVIGASMGSAQAYEWAAAYPELVERIVPVIPYARADAYGIQRFHHWREVITLDPKWQGGDYYGGPGPVDGLRLAFKLITVDALAPEWGEAGFGRAWAEEGADPAADFAHAFAVEHWMAREAAARAAVADANHLIYLARAVSLYTVGGRENLEEGLKLIKAKVLLLPARTDHLLFAEATRTVRDLLRAQGNEVDYAELEGAFGHLNGVALIAQAGERIAAFLAR